MWKSYLWVSDGNLNLPTYATVVTVGTVVTKKDFTKKLFSKKKILKNFRMWQNSECDKTQKPKMWPNSKMQNVTKQKMWQKSKTQNVTKFKNLDSDKTQKLKM